MSHTRSLFRHARIAAAVMGVSLLGALPAHAAPLSHAFAKHKLVMSISQPSPKRQQLVLNNTANVLRAFGQDNIRVEIVAFGPGLKLLLKNNPHAKVIQALKAEGVEFAACHNTMMAMHIQKSALNPAATVVPGGIVELVRREEQGWSYVKP
ncbi:MAG TPA: DsrE family protein [Acidiferrobacteraceae bacterium]|nr:DsrE family protein [Acidiferrobacteraceae bacterium]